MARSAATRLTRQGTKRAALSSCPTQIRIGIILKLGLASQLNPASGA